MGTDHDNVLSRKRGAKRQALYREFGPAMLRRAEFDVLVGLCISSGMFTADQFIDYTEALLRDEDRQRALRAGMEPD